MTCFLLVSAKHTSNNKVFFLGFSFLMFKDVRDILICYLFLDKDVMGLLGTSLISANTVIFTCVDCLTMSITVSVIALVFCLEARRRVI